MQDSDNGDAKAGRPKVNDVQLNAVPSIFWPDMGAALRKLWSFGQLSTGGLEQIGVAQGLRQALSRHGVVENAIKVALRPLAQPILSHIGLFCAA